jgi:hypothetical protein
MKKIDETRRLKREGCVLTRGPHRSVMVGKHRRRCRHVVRNADAMTVLPDSYSYRTCPSSFFFGLSRPCDSNDINLHT